MDASFGLAGAEDLPQALRAGLSTSFIDAALESEPAARTSLLINDAERGLKVMTEIEAALESCSEFAISVAFITVSGIAPLMQLLPRLAAKGVRGRILTTDYLRFTQPAALRKLMALSNIELRIFRTDEGRGEGFHTKGYLFRSGELCRIIVGSSNMTQAALTTTREWNLNLLTRDAGEVARTILAEFDMLWSRPESRRVEEVIDLYEAEWRNSTRAQREADRVIEEQIEAQPVKPNAMQRAFVERLRALRKEGETRALLISATGTGKTYAAAFAVADMAPRRMLFLVHREQIARQALRSFRRVIGREAHTYGLYAGGEKTAAADYVFATVQSVVRPGGEAAFAPNAFDVVVIDEAHRAAAPTYEKLMKRFRPKFWLGMTGSPDRMDGGDVYALFDHNIAGEIRLQQALENNFLTPFHYFGIADLTTLDDEGRAKRIAAEDFRLTAQKTRFDQMVQAIEWFCHSGDRRRGLVFAGSNDEARAIAEHLTQSGHPALALSGATSQEDRERAVRRLAHGTAGEILEFLVTVDIFNEGVDIPEVNEVVLMRPTESAVVFIQQLGRGLRKAPEKEFVTVLDFIGANEKNYLIATALSGDRSCSREKLRKFVASDAKRLPGASTIHFDEISSRQIFRTIDSAKLDAAGVLKDAYRRLKAELGRPPELRDFEARGSLEPLRFLLYGDGSWHGFLAKYEPEYKEEGGALTPEAVKRLVWLSLRTASGIRPLEALVLKAALIAEGGFDEDADDRAALESFRESSGLADALDRSLRALIGRHATGAERMSVGRVLSLGFERNSQERAKWTGCAVLDPDFQDPAAWRLDADFAGLLQNRVFRKRVGEIVRVSLERWRRVYSRRWKDTFLVLNETYAYDEVARLLNWPKNISAQIVGGYFLDQETKTLPVFINYEKRAGAIAYHDAFRSPSELLSLSKRNRTSSSMNAQWMTKAPGFEDVRILLFVRRTNEAEGAKAFYFLGEMEAAASPQDVRLTDGANAFEIVWRLETPVRRDVYDYLTGG